MNRGNQASREISSVRKRSSSIPSKPHDPLFVRTPKLHRRPISLYGRIFELETNVEDYAEIWDQNAEVKKFE